VLAIHARIAATGEHDAANLCTVYGLGVIHDGSLDDDSRQCNAKAG
jgi:hypothetical protein